MVANTDAQACLNPALVGAGASRVIAIAREHAALGWKVNGAGGDGGSVTLLSNAPASSRSEMMAAIQAASPAFRQIPIRLSRSGLRVWTTEPAAD